MCRPERLLCVIKYSLFESVEKKSGKRNVLMGSRKMYIQGREEAIKRVGVVVSSGEKKPLAPTPLQKDGDRNEISLVAQSCAYSQYYKIPLYKRCENQPHNRNPNELLVPFKSCMSLLPEYFDVLS